jgi:hypothetical protein
MTTIPFVIDDAYAGLAHCHGLLRDEGKELVIEHQTEDSIAGVFKGNLHEIRIPLSAISGIRLESSWFGWSNTLVLQLSSMKHCSELPGAKRGRLVVRISRADRAAAESLVASVSRYLEKGQATTVDA